MKKSIFMLIIIVMIVSSNYFLSYSSFNGSENSLLLNQTKLENEDTKEEVFDEIIRTTLHPYILRDIGSYYEKTLKHPPSVSPYVTKVIKIEKPDRTNQFKFLITIRVRPYVGTDYAVGEDEITYNLDWGKINLENYKHVKEYKLPPHLEHLYK